ncbi:hypothetical protein [Microcoleus sp. D2_18a_D3]|uniref:hypothetical protein n=1 Tax=Microcoleus sp. D2_18a_D3 TaxID=3055330 RepID=UPI002FD49A32
MRSPALKLSGGTASNKLLRIGLLASQYINCRAALAGISAARRLIAMLGPIAVKGCRLIFLGRIYSAFLSATESQNLNEIGRRDSPHGDSFARAYSHSTNIRNRLLGLSHNKYSSFQLDEIQVGTQALSESLREICITLNRKLL